ncbi:MAG: tyrosine--tRNA ligase [Actinomycetota bacterium]|nr:tyrosine--tRNA ligase [Actinomycetota bacterium]
MEALRRGVETLLPEGELERRLGRPLRVKLGVDPTAAQVHLGWAVVLRKLRQFQELGHTAVLIVGDFTAQVGDPSQQSDTRKRLSVAEVRGFAAACLGGLRKVLLPERLEVRYNSEWLGSMSMDEVLELASSFTVARMLDREDFSQRYAGGQPISLLEFMYPLLQGMDSVAVRADVELGGSDQLWNLLAARDIQERYGQQPQVVMTVPLLVGTDGTRKMSQSLGNYIGIEEPPEEMFGKVMSAPDQVMPQYFLLATALPQAEVEQVAAELERGGLDPNRAKRRLAREIVALYWGAEAAHQAEANFDRLFVEHRAPQEVPGHPLPDGDPVWLPGVLRDAGLVESSSEAKRLISQGAIRLEGQALQDEEVGRHLLLGRVMQVGKRRFVRLLDPGNTSPPGSVDDIATGD